MGGGGAGEAVSGVASALGGEVIRHYCLRFSVVLRASRVTFVNVHDAPDHPAALNQCPQVSQTPSGVVPKTSIGVQQ